MPRRGFARAGMTPLYLATVLDSARISTLHSIRACVRVDSNALSSCCSVIMTQTYMCACGCTRVCMCLCVTGLHQFITPLMSHHDPDIQEKALEAAKTLMRYSDKGAKAFQDAGTGTYIHTHTYRLRSTCRMGGHQTN